ncbi:nitroreductase family protein [Dactylosporangium vinaceum]|uniref:Nitroreductase family protein n=1 Tax=Dactylosporangium vinaceum TaxID=53362 RepID=A0ABV5MRV1_9ACTN|nr:nitroreductase family protein [Dactylosporangium vinaceum]UAC00329.1 nitroreductase family protein [Dactylosporangium vinaceum]
MRDDLTPPGLHPLLAARWSPTVFDPAFEVTPAGTELLVEAARWAPSAGNSQPWAFIVARRGDDTHRRLIRHLAPSAGRWAPSASVLVANLAHRWVEGTDWEFSEFAHYDLGQAVAHMTFQAGALGLSVRQFRAFDQAAVAADFAVPGHWEVTSMSAIGRVPADSGPRPPSALSPAPARVRRPVDDLLWTAADPPG